MREYDTVDETTADDGTSFRVALVADDSPTSPRDDYSNAGVIYVVDQPRHNVPQEADVPGLDAAIIDHDFRVVARWLRVVHGASVVLPLYDGTTRDFNIYAGTADETPEAGNYIGVTFDTASTRQDTIGVNLIPAAEEVPTMARALAADVDTYAKWAEGDVWGFVIETGPGGDDVTLPVGMGSCWGFIGYDVAEEAAREALAEAVEHYNEQATADAQRAADDDAETDDLRRTELAAFSAVFAG